MLNCHLNNAAVHNRSTCLNDTVPASFFNELLIDQNPSSYCPPTTDSGSQQSFKYPFAFAHRAIYRAGWARQVNVNDFPIATRMSGVQMRLIKDGVRELHWHTSSEWAIMLYGRARITLLDPQGRGYVDEISAGDLWFFPSGHPHSIQGIGDDGALFLLVFNSGTFNEFGTFQLTDWLIHIPLEVLSKNFQVPKSIFSNLPPKELYIFEGQVPRPLQEDQNVSKVMGYSPRAYTFYAHQMKPNYTRRGGMVNIIDANNFPVTDIAAAIVTLKPGAMRELHWHPNADEWSYFIKGLTKLPCNPCLF